MEVFQRKGIYLKVQPTMFMKQLKMKQQPKYLDVSDNADQLLMNIQKFNPDVIFNCLHGYFGEDGQIQSILNYLKIPYTHSGVLTSAILMNKIISKKLFQSLGIRSPEFLMNIILIIKN